MGYAENMADQRVDSELRSLWEEMINRLVERDIERALGYFAYSSRGRYREQFKLIEEGLSEIFSGMREIEPVYIKEDDAKYRIRIKDEGGELTGYIWFRRDVFGRWKIDKF